MEFKLSKQVKTHFLILNLLLPCASYASFIETTMGTAIVNDATAAYYNPAALTLLKNPQMIPLVTVSRFQTQFNGQVTTVATKFTESGTSNSSTFYYSPSLYLGSPLNDRVTIGFAAVTNYANRNPEDSSILRYVQSSNSIQDYDFVPSFGIKLNDYVALGVGINLSYTNFHLQPITGFPGSNIADAESNNQTDGSGVGADAGFLLKPAMGTLIGFNYRSVTLYEQTGKSVFTGTTQISSNNYHFKLYTPARSTLSFSQQINAAFGLIATIQRIQWNIIRNVNVYNLATTTGVLPVIVNASIPYYLHNTWALTLGGNYRFNPKWIVRAAATYNQSPDSGYYQISTGNSYILGGSVGYQINKTIILDASYAHAFMQNKNLNISGPRYLINGTNQGSRDAVSLKMTVNV